jgi:hypothetical protein
MAAGLSLTRVPATSGKPLISRLKKPGTGWHEA